MQTPRRENVQVVIPANSRKHTIGGTENGRLRPLSVQEALQYSPFTTSIAAGHRTAYIEVHGSTRY